MSEANKAIAQRYVEDIWNQGNLAAAHDLLAADYIHHDPNIPEVRGLEAFKQGAAAFRAAFPGRFTVTNLIAEGDKVVLRWTSCGAHKGAYMGIGPAGRPGPFSGITILRISDGKIIEHWAEWDAQGLLQQLAAAPPVAQAKKQAAGEARIPPPVACVTIVETRRGDRT